MFHSLLFSRAVLIPLVLLSLFPQGAKAVTLDVCNEDLTVNEPPKAAVVHDVNLIEIMLALGLEDHIVGYTGLSGWNKSSDALDALNRQIPELAPKMPVREVLVQAKADFLFAGWNYGMRPGGDVTPQRLSDLGIDVYVLRESCIHVTQKPPASLEDLFTDFRNLGAIFHKNDRAEQVIRQLQAELDALMLAHPIQGAPPSVFLYDSGEDAPFTAGRYAMANALIEAAGGRNIFNDFEKSWASVSWEAVIKAQPDLVIIVDYGPVTAEQKMKFLRNHIALRDLHAIRDNQFVVLDYDEVTPGPRNVGAIEKLRTAIANRP